MVGLATGFQQADASQDEPIIGAWLVRFTGSGERTQLLRLTFFLPGGIMLETDAPIAPTTDTNDDMAAREYQTILGGQWLRTGFTTYRYQLLGIDYDVNGNPIGTEEVVSTVEFDRLRDTWSATRRIRDVALDGTPGAEVSPRSPVQATRIRVEP